MQLQSKLSAEGEAQAQRVQMEMHIQRLTEASFLPTLYISYRNKTLECHGIFWLTDRERSSSATGRAASGAERSHSRGWAGAHGRGRRARGHDHRAAARRRARPAAAGTWYSSPTTGDMNIPDKIKLLERLYSD